MYHGSCVSHVPWCMSGPLTRGGGKNYPGIPGACAPAILRIRYKRPMHKCAHFCSEWCIMGYGPGAFCICQNNVFNGHKLTRIKSLWGFKNTIWVLIEVKTLHTGSNKYLRGKIVKLGMNKLRLNFYRWFLLLCNFIDREIDKRNRCRFNDKMKCNSNQCLDTN